MKSIIQKLFLNNTNNSTQEKIQVNEHHLYNLLFSGKISLSEYLEKIKDNN